MRARGGRAAIQTLVFVTRAAEAKGGSASPTLRWTPAAGGQGHPRPAAEGTQRAAAAPARPRGSCQARQPSPEEAEATGRGGVSGGRGQGPGQAGRPPGASSPFLRVPSAPARPPAPLTRAVAQRARPPGLSGHPSCGPSAHGALGHPGGPRRPAPPERGAPPATPSGEPGAVWPCHPPPPVSHVHRPFPESRLRGNGRREA